MLSIVKALAITAIVFLGIAVVASCSVICKTIKIKLKKPDKEKGDK